MLKTAEDTCHFTLNGKKTKEFNGNLKKIDYFYLLFNEAPRVSILSHSHWKLKTGMFSK